MEPLSVYQPYVLPGLTTHKAVRPERERPMSKRQNDEWAETAYDNFQQAVDDGNLSLANDIIEDVKDSGFSDLARRMKQEIKNINE